MKVYDFFKFISDKRPKYHISEWGPKIMKGTIKHLKPVRGESEIDYENYKVSGRFEYGDDDSYKEVAIFGDNSELKSSYIECDLSTYKGFQIFKSIYGTITKSDYVLWKAFKVLSKENELELQKIVSDIDEDEEILSVDSFNFEKYPTELINLIRNVLTTKLTEQNYIDIKQNDNLDMKQLLNHDDGMVLLTVLSSAQYARNSYPQIVINLVDYVYNCFRSCAQYDADDLNSSWFDGTAPESFDDSNNIERADVSRFPYVKLILSGNELTPYFNYDKQLVSFTDVNDGVRIGSYRRKGVDVGLINYYLEKYPFES